LTAIPSHRRVEVPPQVHYVHHLNHVRHGRHSRRRPSHVLPVLAVAGCEVAGMAAVVRGYQIAETRLTSDSEFVWFWIGMFLLELPLAAVIVRRATSRAMRTALLVIYGFVTYAPKLLRDPTSPLYHDEFGHWRETSDILSSGKLFQPTPVVAIASQYPGLHTATAAVVHATGLTIWQAALLLLILFHVTLVLGIAELANALGFNNRTASITPILYGLNSSFLYFDTQYAYESMALTLLVWTLVAYVLAIRSRTGPELTAWSGLTVLLSAGTVITHHLSSLALLVIMALISVAVSMRWLARTGKWIRAAVTAWSLAAVLALMVSAWFVFVAPQTLAYLSPYLDQGFSQVLQIAGGSGGARQLFTSSLSPWWEQKSAYLLTVFALGLAIVGMFLIRARIKDGELRKGRRRALILAFTLLGLLYFPSTIFILSSAGEQGARRSWAFTWIGLCMLLGPAAIWLLDWVGRRTHQWLRVTLYSVLLAALAVGLVGGTSAGLDASYRFPGPFLYGSDARSVTPELLGTSEWFSARFGTGNNVVTDRFTGLIFASFGMQNTAIPSGSLPTYDLYLAKPGAPIEPPFLLPNLEAQHYTYLIVDERMAYEVPEIGVYFEGPPYPFLSKTGKSLFHGRLAKFNRMSWMVKVYQSDNYCIYRLNLPVAKTGYLSRAPRSRGKLLVTR
jgi:hypothetical protein